MGKKENDARREQIEREAQRELEELTRRQGPGGPGGFPGAGGFGGPPGGGGGGGVGFAGALSPLEQMAKKVQNREVGREARGEQPRRQAQQPPVEMFMGPVGSGLTPGFGPGKRSGMYQEPPPAFTEDAPPENYAPGYGSYTDADFDEDEEISITEMAVMDHAARHGLNPEDAMIRSDPDNAEEMRDRAMQQYMRRQSRQGTSDGVVTDPFAPAGMRGRAPGAPGAGGADSGPATVSRLNTRRNQPNGGGGGGALARLRERRRLEEAARRMQEEEQAAGEEQAEPPVAPGIEDVEEIGGTQPGTEFGTDIGEETEEFYDEAGAADDEPEAYEPEAYGPEEYGPEEYGPEEYGPEEYGPEAYEPEPEPEAPAFGGGALGRLLAKRAAAERQAEPAVPAAPVAGWSAGAPGRLHTRERLAARAAASQDVDDEGVDEDAGDTVEPIPMPAPASSTSASKSSAVGKLPKKPSTTRKGVKQVATAKKAGSAGKSAVKKAASKATSAKKAAPSKASGSSKKSVKSAAKKSMASKSAQSPAKASEKKAMAKTPAAKRSRSIKATAKKK